MKNLILVAGALACATSIFAQGTVFFNNRLPGTTVSRIYGPNPVDGYIIQSGNGPGDFPAGTTDWSGFTPLSGNSWSVPVWAAPGSGQAESSLQAALPTTTMRTGAAAGFVNPLTITLTGVAADAPVATVQVRVWDNQGGTITTWSDALGHVTAGWSLGKSPLFDVLKIGGRANPAPSLDGLVSFNLLAPEPSTFALAGLGAVALLIFRRRKP